MYSDYLKPDGHVAAIDSDGHIGSGRMALTKAQAAVRAAQVALGRARRSSESARAFLGVVTCEVDRFRKIDRQLSLSRSKDLEVALSDGKALVFADVPQSLDNAAERTEAEERLAAAMEAVAEMVEHERLAGQAVECARNSLADAVKATLVAEADATWRRS